MAALNFWTEDRDGERWLINGPELVIASNRPKKKGKRNMYFANKPRPGTKAWMSYIRTLRKGSKNRSHSKRTTHRKAKRNMYSAGQVANRPKTRTVTRTVYVKRNSPRQSAGLMGFNLGGIMTPVAGAFAGLTVPPVLDYFVKPYVPAAIAGNVWGTRAVQALEVIVPSWLVKKYVNRSVGNIMLTVGLGKLLFDIARPYIPGLSGIGYQPMLGYYPARRQLPNTVPLMQPPMIASTPDRLNPASRF